MSYGYGLSTSLFQIAQAYSIFATDGELVPMSLIRRDQGDGVGPLAAAEDDAPPTLAFKAAFRPQAADSHSASRPVADPVQVRGKPVISPETAKAVREMLALTTGPGGTAPKAQALGYS